MTAELVALARLAGVQPTYRGFDGLDRQVDPEVTVEVLRALGVPIDRAGGAREALAAERAGQRAGVLEPVLVHRVGDPPVVPFEPPETLDPTACWLTLTLEDGTSRHGRLADLVDTAVRDGGRAGVYLPGTPEPVPPGYHQLVLEAPGTSASALVVSAPRCPEPGRGWGVFCPLYAIRTADDWGSGTYPDLAELGAWVRSAGGSFVGVLPLYPAFLDGPADPSPYLPVTRLGYNEFYVHPDAVPELAAVPVAAEVLSSAGWRDRLAAARRSPLVDYEGLSRLRREVLQPLADSLVAGPGADGLRGFCAEHPELLAYARFRAGGERHGRDWRRWDEATTAQVTAASLGDPDVRYHACAQWLASMQMAAAAKDAPVYGDLPVGVHPLGFDPFFEPDAFAGSVRGGAPPDRFFAGGQDWGFPPLHPRGIREQRYRHVIDVLRVAFAHVVALRIDHVMGLHRLWWVPEGAAATEGAYVSYPADELHALVALEAHRAGAAVVGEDLGTVEPSVREAMTQERMLRTWVLEFRATPEDPLPEPPENCVASIGSHDVPRFAAFFRGAEPGDPRVVAELADGPLPGREARARWRAALAALSPCPAGAEADPGDQAPPAERSALEECLAHLASGPAAMVLVDLQDLWGELAQENRPGTGVEAGNWRHRSALDLDQVRAAPEVAAGLSLVDLCRGVSAVESAGLR